MKTLRAACLLGAAMVALAGLAQSPGPEHESGGFSVRGDNAGIGSGAALVAETNNSGPPAGGLLSRKNAIDDTFVFMDDIHCDHSIPERQKEIAATLAAIRDLNGQSWPNSSGAKIDIQAVFINGDLCEQGGGYPGARNKVQGPNLIEFINLFPSKLPSKAAAYIGLGNHDLDWGPAKGTSIQEDYFRDQMWYTHRKWTATNPKGCIQTVTELDSESSADFSHDNPPFRDWKKHSQNWLVNTGGVIYIQFHRFGGDDRFEHAKGFDALKDWLSKYPSQGIVIMQHFGWDDRSTNTKEAAGTYWTTAQRDEFIKQFGNRTIIGVFHGHIHDPPPYAYEGKSAGRTFNCFAPGSVATHKRFGLARITQNHLEVEFYQVGKDGKAQVVAGKSYSGTW